MNILISNDDGIFSPGITTLASAAQEFGAVNIVAPEYPQSAKAHSITLHHPLTTQYVHLGGDISFDTICVNGSPADCVRLAVKNLLDDKPDLVLSGINAGANVGVNVFYSGTVAAAAEAAMMGIPAVAFSADTVTFGERDPDFTIIMPWVRKILGVLLKKGLSPGELVNVNFPVPGENIPRGVKVCAQSDADVDDKYTVERPESGNRLYYLSDTFDFDNPHRESDIARLREGYITVTPLKVDLTDHGLISGLEALFEKGF